MDAAPPRPPQRLRGNQQANPQQEQQKNVARLRRQVAQMMATNALLKSIPKTILPKEERFKQGAGTNLRFAARGHGYYDAFVQQAHSIVLASQVGPCTAIEAHCRATIPGRMALDLSKHYFIPGAGPGNELNAGVMIPLPAQDYSTLIVFNPGSSDSQVGAIYSLDTSGTNMEVKLTPLMAAAFVELGPTITNLDADADTVKHDTSYNYDPSGRVENIPIRGSLRIRNITENYSVGGEVRFLRYNGGLSLGSEVWDGNNNRYIKSSVLGVTEYMGLCDMIRDSARTRVLDGAELRAAHQLNTYPADAIRSLEFKEDTSFFEAVRTPKFNTLLILIDNFVAGSGANNSYSLNAIVQRAARFRPGSLLHNAARTPHSDSTKHTEHIKQAATELLKNVALGAASGGLSGAAKGAADHFLGNTKP